MIAAPIPLLHFQSVPDSPAESEPIGSATHWKFLADASELLDSSLDYQSTLTNVLHLAVPAIADFSAIALRDADGSMSWGASVHRDPAKAILAARLRGYQPAFNNPAHPARETLRANVPLLIGNVDEPFLRSIARDDTHFELLRAFAFTSLIFAPLWARERSLGLLIFGATEDSGRRYAAADVTLALEIGRRAALAVDNALLYQAAEESARARDVMMGVVSHDLKNPLSTISMAASFLLEDVIPDDESRVVERKQLAAVQRAAERMFRLIHDLLDVTAIEGGRISLGRRRVQPVQPLIDDALDLLRPLSSAKKIELVTEIPESLPMVNVDRDRLLQVFSNLGGNAMKFTPDGGRVTITVRVADDALQFTLSDTGPGIDEASLPHVFDRFWQAKTTAHLGTGLGLAIAKGIVEAHGGEIGVRSKVGEGTEFEFTIPVGAPH